MLELNNLYNMDCMDGMRGFPDKYFDLAIVDVPYGIGESGAKNHSRSKLAVSRNYTAFHCSGSLIIIFRRRKIDMKGLDNIDVREIRHKLGMNQSQFWSQIGVTQSGGSRYESGRNIPRPVQALLRLVHIEQIDISKVRKEDMEVADYLRATNPELFKNLKKEARTKRKDA